MDYKKIMILIEELNRRIIYLEQKVKILSGE
ncbi:unknown [Acidaminococcus sp. CAG:917]|nr:unknown [Acidaminococcus sp. CAG:917]